jgi:rubrerythrin
MVRMDLGTFGAIMKFALEVETEVTRFYESAQSLAKDEDLAGVFGSLASRGEKRLKTIERIRRENVTEMILEPIVGLDSDAYQPTTSIPEDVDDSKLTNIAREIEKKLNAFYNDAATKLEFLSEVAYSFEILAEANDNSNQRFVS